MVISQGRERRRGPDQGDMRKGGCMLEKRGGPLIRFVTSVIAIALCHFGAFAVCYFFYRKSYYRAPTSLQSLCGVISQILGYPLWLIRWVPSEPNRPLFVALSMLNSLVYAVILALFVRLLRPLFKRKPNVHCGV